jgi:glycosyltransferase involved in cell wall biosynthesis
MNMPSFYQDDLFAALAASEEVDLRVIFARPLAPERLAIGWEPSPRAGLDRAPLTEPVSGQVCPSLLLDRHAPVLNAMRLAWTQRDRLHLINGIWAEPAFAAALCVLMATQTRYAIYSEAPNPYRARRRWKQTVQAAFGGSAVRRSKGLLPVGRFGEDFFRSLGARPEQLYPFGYFRSNPNDLPVRRTRRDNETRCELIYVGQLIERKGVDLLLEAVASVPLSLAIVGDGERRDSLKDMAVTLGIADRVHFEEVIPSSQVPDRIAQADLLVLPSRWDGWGLVVNEALMVGVPVLASDGCGASELVREGQNGYVFRSGDVLDLQDKLRRHLNSRPEWERLRVQAAGAGRRVSAEQASTYLIQCMKHMLGTIDVRPTPPWEVQDEDRSIL